MPGHGGGAILLRWVHGGCVCRDSLSKEREEKKGAKWMLGEEHSWKMRGSLPGVMAELQEGVAADSEGGEEA